eukprot:g44954.t1
MFYGSCLHVLLAEADPEAPSGSDRSSRGELIRYCYNTFILCHKNFHLVLQQAADALMLLCLLLGVGWAESVPSGFIETLLVRYLPDDKLLSHFEFKAGTSSDYHLFPKALGQVLHRYAVQELHLSLTQGRWQYGKWGYAEHPGYAAEDWGELPEAMGWLLQRPVHAAPIGAEIWAWLVDNQTEPDRRGGSGNEGNWNGLLSSLAGIFCSSLNQVDLTQTSTPLAAFRPTSTADSAGSTTLRHAALPREVVCTENLTPWAKLLPCRKESGLATLLNSLRLYDMHYHSLAAHVIATSTGWQLVLTADIVTNHHLRQVHASTKGGQRFQNWNHSWSLSSLFDVGTSMLEGCPISSRSAVLLQPPSGADIVYSGLLNGARTERSVLRLTASPDFVLHSKVDANHRLLVFDVSPGSNEKRLSLNAEFSRSFFQSPPTNVIAPVTFQRYQTGRGQIHAELNIALVNNDPKRSFRVHYFESLPWFLKPYWHTLKIQQDFSPLDLRSLSMFKFLPALHQGPPSQLELELDLPPLSITQMVMRVEKLFLLIDQYPPDVSRGFDIQAAVLTIHEPRPFTGIRLYSEQFLVLLPFPDMSMPFNVIAFTSTVLAFFFGSMFNMLYKPNKEILVRTQGGYPFSKAIERCRVALSSLRAVKSKWN